MSTFQEFESSRENCLENQQQVQQDEQVIHGFLQEFKSADDVDVEEDDTNHWDSECFVLMIFSGYIDPTSAKRPQTAFHNTILERNVVEC